MTDPEWRLDPMAVIERANVLPGLRRAEQAVELLRSAMAAWPDRPELWGQLSAALLGADRAEEALAAAEELVAREPDDEWGYRLSALAFPSLVGMSMRFGLPGRASGSRRCPGSRTSWPVR